MSVSPTSLGYFVPNLFIYDISRMNQQHIKGNMSRMLYYRALNIATFFRVVCGCLPKTEKAVEERLQPPKKPRLAGDNSSGRN